MELDWQRLEEVVTRAVLRARSEEMKEVAEALKLLAMKEDFEKKGSSSTCASTPIISMDRTQLTQLTPAVKVKELPQNIVIKIETGEYEVEINTIHAEPMITVKFAVSLDNWSTIQFYDPNPEAMVNSIVEDAVALIEKYRSKKRNEE